jgi:hypothetical protein
MADSNHNQFDNLKAAFPHLRSLDPEFYTREPYKSNKTRRCKILVLIGAMSNFEPFRQLSHEQQNVLARRIESGCVNETLRKAKEDNVGCSWQTEEFVRRYGTTVREKAQELDYNMNTWLIPRVVSGEINPSRIASLTEDEANPDALRDMNERRAARLAAKVERKRSKGYPCDQCDANGEPDPATGRPEGWAYITNVQTRGLDEAKCTRAECCMCGHTWEVEK